MRTYVVAAALLAGAVLPGAVRAADPPLAGPPVFTGHLCGFAAMSDPEGSTTSAQYEVGEIDGGPVLVADLDLADNPASATLTCSLQVGATGVYTEPDAVVAAASGTGAVYLPPTPIRYAARVSDTVWTCSEVATQDGHGDTVTRYYDYPSATFVVDPATAHCSPSQETDPCEFDPEACGWPVTVTGEAAYAGHPCDVLMSDDPTGSTTSRGSQWWVVGGGPVAVIPAEPGANPAPVTLTCRVTVGGSGAYADADWVRETASGPGVVALPPTLAVRDAVFPTAPVWVCTEVVADGAPAAYYDATSGVFVTDPVDARCESLVSMPVPPDWMCDALTPVCDLPVAKP